jgi:hypothetical protein
MPPDAARLLFELVFGSARVRALLAGALIGSVAHALGRHAADGWLAPAMAAVVVLAGAASVLCLALEHAPRRNPQALQGAARQALLCVGIGILLAMHLPRWWS